MTLREIDIALKSIEVRRYNDVALQAALKGNKIPFKQSAFQVKEISDSFTKEEAKAADDVMSAAMNRFKKKNAIRTHFAKKAQHGRR